MFNKNSYLAGILIALVFPAVSLVAAYFLRDYTLLLNKPALPYLVAIALNIILMRLSGAKDQDKTVKGMMIVTFVFMLVMFYFKLHHIR